MVRKNAIALMLASKRAVSPTTGPRNNVRATGMVVRSTKVMITERRDVPIVHSSKSQNKLTRCQITPITRTVKNQVKVTGHRGTPVIFAAGTK